MKKNTLSLAVDAINLQLRNGGTARLSTLESNDPAFHVPGAAPSNEDYHSQPKTWPEQGQAQLHGGFLKDVRAFLKRPASESVAETWRAILDARKAKFPNESEHEADKTLREAFGPMLQGDNGFFELLLGKAPRIRKAISATYGDTGMGRASRAIEEGIKANEDARQAASGSVWGSGRQEGVSWARRGGLPAPQNGQEREKPGWINYRPRPTPQELAKAVRAYSAGETSQDDLAILFHRDTIMTLSPLIDEGPKFRLSPLRSE